MDHPLAQPYIPQWMKSDFNSMSLQELTNLVRWEGLPVEIFGSCKSKDDYVNALKIYINDSLHDQQIRKQKIIDYEIAYQTKMIEHRRLRDEHRAKKIAVVKKIRKLKRQQNKTIADYQTLCQLYEDLFALSTVPADKYKF
jgi:hypothetical protein